MTNKTNNKSKLASFNVSLTIEDKQRYKDYQDIVKNDWRYYQTMFDNDSQEYKFIKTHLTKDEIDDFNDLTKKQIVKDKQVKKFDYSIKWLDLYMLKTEKQKHIDNMSKYTRLLHKHKDNQNLVNLILRKIDKDTFTFKTFCSQIFDLTRWQYLDTQDKYNQELLHFDLFMKNENLSNKLLYYRMINTKSRCDFDKYNLDLTKWHTYNQTENNILTKVTNDIIIDTIMINDKVKLDFIKIYQKNINKYWHSNNDRKTIQRYKDYIIDTYGYLFSD